MSASFHAYVTEVPVCENAPAKSLTPPIPPLILGPNITGGHSGCPWVGAATGAFSVTDQSTIPTGSGWGNSTVDFSASRSSSIYSGSAVTPLSYSAQYLIKY